MAAVSTVFGVIEKTNLMKIMTICYIFFRQTQKAIVFTRNWKFKEKA